jgi:predicted DNA-binding WGR domain protein
MTPPEVSYLPAVGWELTLIDPSRRHRKFYRLIVFGPILLVNFGPIGSPGQFRPYRLPSFGMARNKAVVTTAEKERKGYRKSISPLPFSVPAELLETCDTDPAARGQLIQAFLRAGASTRPAS